MGDRDLAPSEWISEPVLWTSWVHVGALKCQDNGVLYGLSSAAFQNITAQFKTKSFYPAIFAHLFVAALNGLEKKNLSDLTQDMLDVAHLVQQCFGENGSIPMKKNFAYLSRSMKRPSESC